jgi:hypothetical protein
MLFHLSIEADNPQRMAQFFAEAWEGEALPFPSVTPGSWAALSGDDRGTIIEIYPRGTEIHAAEGDRDAIGVRVAPHRHNATHMAIATPKSEADIYALCDRYGYSAKYRRRGGVFGVIEIFAEDCQMIEILTDEMQREYTGAVTIENWKMMLKAQGLPEAA